MARVIWIESRLTIVIFSSVCVTVYARPYFTKRIEVERRLSTFPACCFYESSNLDWKVLVARCALPSPACPLRTMVAILIRMLGPLVGRTAISRVSFSFATTIASFFFCNIRSLLYSRSYTPRYYCLAREKRENLLPWWQLTTKRAA
jgi:hypothetical protein